MALQITIGGVDVTNLVDFTSIRVEDSREVKGDTFEFTLKSYDNAHDPSLGKEVIFTDGSTREFGGVLIELDLTPGEGQRLLTYRCICMDYTYYLDRRYLNKLYQSKAVDAMLVEIITDLKNAATGDDHYLDFFTNINRTTEILAGPVVREQTFQRILPSQALDQIAESSGMTWWVDFNKHLRLVSIDFDVAPIDPLDVETSTEYYDFVYSRDIKGVGTKPIIRDAIVKSTDTVTEAITWNTGDSHSIRLAQRPYGALQVVSVRKGATLQTHKLENVDRRLSDDTSEANTVFIYVGPVGQNTAYVRFPSGNLSDGDVITIVYNYGEVSDYEGFDPDSQSLMAALTSGGGKNGDGVHEFVFSQASEITAVSETDLDYIMDLLITRKGKPLVTGSFRTLTKGFVAGQAFTLDWARAQISDLVYVVTVRRTVKAPVGLTAPIIESHIQFSNVPHGLRM